jgi:hypothetical protein
LFSVNKGEKVVFTRDEEESLVARMNEQQRATLLAMGGNIEQLQTTNANDNDNDNFNEVELDDVVDSSRIVGVEGVDDDDDDDNDRNNNHDQNDDNDDDDEEVSMAEDRQVSGFLLANGLASSVVAAASHESTSDDVNAAPKDVGSLDNVAPGVVPPVLLADTTTTSQ